MSDEPVWSDVRKDARQDARDRAQVENGLEEAGWRETRWGSGRWISPDGGRTLAWLDAWRAVQAERPLWGSADPRE